MPNPKSQLMLCRPMWRPRRKRPSRLPTIRFSPYAWAKLLSLRDLGPTEVGGFGVADPDDLLFVEDFALVTQQCTETFVAFDDVAVADFFEDQVALGRRPEQVGRIWIHTHPGDSPQPSQVDVETFQRVFGGCDWAVMFIIARGGHTYAELQWRHGGPASIQLDVQVDFTRPFSGSDESAWRSEYAAAVHIARPQLRPVACQALESGAFPAVDDPWEQMVDFPYDGLTEFDIPSDVVQTRSGHESIKSF